METRTVSQGDCFNSIAKECGFAPDKLWNHPDNSALRELRKDPSVLKPGDEVNIPDKEEKFESRGCDARHRFRKKGTPAKVVIRVLRNDEPRANQPYRLTVDGQVKTGRTDGNGQLEANIPPDARHGELSVGEGNDVEIYPLGLGTLDPVDTEDGARGRLHGLGYDTDQEFPDALRDFQNKEKLQVTGELDQATQNKLKERFGE